MTLAWKFSKQRLVAPNILVCYTTSHGSATTAALQWSWGKRSVRRIGEALKASHQHYGGLTQLIAVVWRLKSLPQVLELTPPEYRPQPRTGIIGIGDPGPLQWFRENFQEDPRPILQRSTATPEMVDAISKHIGQRVDFPGPTFTIDDAALNVAGALTIGIEQKGGPTVGLPLQVMVVHKGAVRQVPVVVLTENAKNVTMATIDHRQVKLPPPVFPRIDPDVRRLPATQLFP